MVTLSEKSSILLRQLPQITRLKDLIDLSCSLLKASLYIIDGNGHILEHSDKEPVTCQSWLNSVERGYLDDNHKKAVLTPEVNCNVIRDRNCMDTPCARLSIPFQPEESVLPGAIVFFLWDNDPTIEKQCIALILAGALSNLLQKERREKENEHNDSVKVLKDLLNYKPGLKLYFYNALGNSEFAEKTGPYKLCILVPEDPHSFSPDPVSGKLSELSDRYWFFEHLGHILIVYGAEDYAQDDFRSLVEPLLEENRLQACCSVGFDDLLKLRYIYKDTLSALKFASQKEKDTRFHTSDRYLSLVFLDHCRQLLPSEEYYPDFFHRLTEHDKKTGKTYLQTLSAYLDNGRNANAAAKQLFMHRNTMAQQLDRIEQILGVSLNNSETAFFLQLCIRMHELE